MTMQGTIRSLVLATQNKNKVQELEYLLSANVETMSVDHCASAFGLASIPALPEAGSTYYENALSKAIAVQKWCKMPTLSDDSGLECAALDGAPGVYSARYGGTTCSYEDRFRMLEREIAHASHPSSQARFVCVLCYYDGSSPPVFFQGDVVGSLVAPQGARGFGYDPIFFCPKLGKTFAQAESKEKWECHHRSVAVRAFVQHYSANLIQPGEG